MESAIDTSAAVATRGGTNRTTCTSHVKVSKAPTWEDEKRDCLRQCKHLGTRVTADEKQQDEQRESQHTYTRGHSKRQNVDKKRAVLHVT